MIKAFKDKIKKLFTKLKISKKEFFIALFTFITGVLISASSFSINKLVERKYFPEKEYEFTMEDMLQYFPLAEGNTWIYKGYAEYLSTDGELIKSEFDDYQITVKKTYTEEDISIVLIEESFFPDPFYSKDVWKKNNLQIWVLAGGKVYVIRNEEEINNFIISIENNESPFIDIGESYVSWDFPLYVGKKYNLKNTLILSNSNRYLDNISEKRKISISGITYNRDCFKTEEYMSSNESYSWFCPGLGEVEHEYKHHSGRKEKLFYRLKEFFVKE